jgi:multidrug efflux pump subunit AcrB
VVPLFCARIYQAASHHGNTSSELPGQVELRSTRNRWRLGEDSMSGSTIASESFLRFYDRMVGGALRLSWLTLTLALCGIFVRERLCFRARIIILPRTDAGMFVINVKAPDPSCAFRLRKRSRKGRAVDPVLFLKESDRGVILSNIGVTPGFPRSIRAIPPNTLHSIRSGLKDKGLSELRVYGRGEAEDHEGIARIEYLFPIRRHG